MTARPGVTPRSDERGRALGHFGADVGGDRVPSVILAVIGTRVALVMETGDGFETVSV